MEAASRAMEGGRMPMQAASRAAEGGCTPMEAASRAAEGGCIPMEPASRAAEGGCTPMEAASRAAEGGCTPMEGGCPPVLILGVCLQPFASFCFAALACKCYFWGCVCSHLLVFVLPLSAASVNSGGASAAVCKFLFCLSRPQVLILGVCLQPFASFCFAALARQC